ncbi:MAG: hypothetical protein ACPGSI_18485 [Pikeienuella sp.]
MKGFEPVTLSWQGESYTVPAEGQLMLIASIEDALCGGDGSSATIALLRNGGPTHVQLARAYGAALRHAGSTVTDEEIYLSIQADFAEHSAEASIKINQAILGLLAIVSPPVALSILQPKGKAADVKKKNTRTVS